MNFLIVHQSSRIIRAVTIDTSNSLPVKFAYFNTTANSITGGPWKLNADGTTFDVVTEDDKRDFLDDLNPNRVFYRTLKQRAVVIASDGTVSNTVKLFVRDLVRTFPSQNNDING